MRHRALAVSTLTCIAALGPAGIAAATSPAHGSGAQHFVMTSLTINGAENPSLVIATGPIHGIAIETQAGIDTPEGEALQFTLHFANGTVTAVAVEDYSLDFDPRTCTAKAVGTGTWTISGGTGVYAAAAGSGAFIDRGTLVGARDRHGVCQGPDSDVPPMIAADILQATGTASLTTG